MAELLAPIQLGFGVKGGAEAAVHAARIYLRDLAPDKIMLKLDFRNAFNSLRRDKMLIAVKALAPDLYHFVHSSYSSPSLLFWSDEILQSSEGIQQGDPLGHLLFCLTVFQLHPHLSSDHLLYLDDITLGGSPEQIQHDLEVVDRVASDLGLHLNHHKSELICADPQTGASLLPLIPGAISVDPLAANLLGSGHFLHLQCHRWED